MTPECLPSDALLHPAERDDAVQALTGPVQTDRFAIHGICWAQTAQGVQVSRRADSLAGSLSGQRPQIDPQALFDYLFFHVVPSPRTAFKGVHRLPAGHRLSTDARGQAQVQRHWLPKFAPARSGNFDALKAEFRALVKDAVARRLDGSTPACFLSGGTDSSTVAGMIREVTGGPAQAYSIGFEAEGYDEMAYARLAAKHFGADHHEYYITPADLVKSIPEVAASYDQPFGNSSALPAYYCARMARADGVSQLLAGDGGDELFGGNARYAQQGIFELYQHLPGWLRTGVLEPMLRDANKPRPWLLRKAASYVEQARQPLPGRLDFYNLLVRLGIDNVLTPQFMAMVDRQGPQRDQQKVWDETGADDLLNNQLAFDWRYTLAEIDLPKVCGTTQLAGLAVSFPLLDDALLEFSQRLPLDYKLRGKQLRWFFKEALRGFLPDEIITKTKQGFGLPFGVWMTRDAGLKALAADSLGALVDRRLAQPEFVRRLLNEHLPAHPGFYGEMVWIMVMLEQWLRAHAPDWKAA